MRRTPIPRLLILTTLLLFPFDLFAQARLTGADLDGTVREETGVPLPGATVTVTNVATNLARSATTNQDGRYRVPSLVPGTYVVAAELPGFAKSTRENIVLQLGQSVAVDFKLRQAVEAAVTVTADTPLVDTHSATISKVVGQEQIEGLPINGRNFISFATITPGVTQDNTPQQGASATSGLSFAGAPGPTTSWSTASTTTTRLWAPFAPPSARRRSVSSRS